VVKTKTKNCINNRWKKPNSTRKRGGRREFLKGKPKMIKWNGRCGPTKTVVPVGKSVGGKREGQKWGGGGEKELKTSKF